MAKGKKSQCQDFLRYISEAQMRKVDTQIKYFWFCRNVNSSGAFISDVLLDVLERLLLYLPSHFTFAP